MRKIIFLSLILTTLLAQPVLARNTQLTAQQSATAQQQWETAQQQSATTQDQGTEPHQAAEALGNVVSAQHDGCTQVVSGGIEYYYCGAEHYRAVFQGNSLVYVTSSLPAS